MNPTVIGILVKIAIHILQRYYDQLTDEQKQALKAATAESFKTAGNMGGGADP